MAYYLLEKWWTHPVFETNRTAAVALTVSASSPNRKCGCGGGGNEATMTHFLVYLSLCLFFVLHFSIHRKKPWNFEVTVYIRSHCLLTL